MAKAMWKYTLPVDDDMHALAMPEGAIVRHTGTIGGRFHVVCIWAEVDPTAEKETRHFVVVGTGSSLHGRAEYVGTVVTEIGLVWHVFEAFVGEQGTS